MWRFDCRGGFSGADTKTVLCLVKYLGRGDKRTFSWFRPGRLRCTGARTASAAAACSSQTWAMLIKRVYEVAPLSCPQCGGQLKVVAYIEPPPGDVIEDILKRRTRSWPASNHHRRTSAWGWCARATGSTCILYSRRPQLHTPSPKKTARDARVHP